MTTPVDRRTRDAEDALEKLRERQAKLMELFERRKLALMEALRGRQFPVYAPPTPLPLPSPIWPRRIIYPVPGRRLVVDVLPEDPPPPNRRVVIDVFPPTPPAAGEESWGAWRNRVARKQRVPA